MCDLISKLYQKTNDFHSGLMREKRGDSITKLLTSFQLRFLVSMQD